jgi:hypothetical protein
VEDIRRALCSLEEGRFADLALDVASLLVLYMSHVSRQHQERGQNCLFTYHLELRLGSVLVLSSALALLLSLGTLSLQQHVSTEDHYLSDAMR